MERSRAMTKKKRTSLKGNITWQWPEKKSIYVKKCSCKIKLQLLFTKTIMPLSYQHCLPFIHRSQHYCFLGQANWYRLYRLWQMPRQTWTIFFVQNWFKLVGRKIQTFQANCQQRLPTGTKFYNGRGPFQPDHAIKESAGLCCRKLW